jgi:hypothetical protein
VIFLSSSSWPTQDLQSRAERSSWRQAVYSRRRRDLCSCAWKLYCSCEFLCVMHISPCLLCRHCFFSWLTRSYTCILSVFVNCKVYSFYMDNRIAFKVQCYTNSQFVVILVSITTEITSFLQF